MRCFWDCPQSDRIITGARGPATRWRPTAVRAEARGVDVKLPAREPPPTVAAADACGRPMSTTRVLSSGLTRAISRAGHGRNRDGPQYRDCAGADASRGHVSLGRPPLAVLAIFRRAVVEFKAAGNPSPLEPPSMSAYPISQCACDAVRDVERNASPT